MKNSNSKTFTKGWQDYELIDAGGNQKLERWGDIITIRPERQAYFKPILTKSEWKAKAHLEFIADGKQKGNWKIYKALPENWMISFLDLRFQLNTTQFKHIGLFPEQAVNWQVLKAKLNSNKKFLNLFAYTGAASVVAKSTGAHVTHVDSVKQLISWAKKNQDVSKQKDIRWICDDALKFAKKEVKRNNTYDCIVMDPPAFGLGAKGERWKIEDKLPDLIKTAYALLNKDGLLILNTYSPRVELKDIYNETRRLFDKEKIEATELWQKSSFGKELFYGYLIYALK